MPRRFYAGRGPAQPITATLVFQTSAGGFLEMTTYRAYRLDERRHILNGQWLEAPNDAAAVDQAEDLCEEGVPTVELWQATRLVDQIDCADDEDCPCDD
jgi:hypothetical protein